MQNGPVPRTRPGAPDDVQELVAGVEASYAGLDPAALEHELDGLVAAQERLVDSECVNLYAGTNAPSPKVSRLLGSTIGSRPSLGWPGRKYNRGMQAGEELEILAGALVRRLFGCAHAELRVPSGSIANLYAYMATARPGDRILVFSAAAGGHATHHAEGAAGLYGLEVHELPFDAERMDVDEARLPETLERVRPALVVVGGSLCLHPWAVSAVRAAADDVGAWVLVDAAHVSGLVAAGRFQQPLAEGAHLVTCSTYKSFGGPPGGLVLTDSDELAERLDRIAFPGLTANFDLARTAALAQACLDLLEHGEAYADAAIANAAALAEALGAAGLPVHSCCRGPTASHHVALRGTDADCRLLERANVLASTIGLPSGEGIRLGTQEVTRWGMEPEDMAEVARLFARVLLEREPPERVLVDAVAFRRRFSTLRFVR